MPKLIQRETQKICPTSSAERPKRWVFSLNFCQQLGLSIHNFENCFKEHQNFEIYFGGITYLNFLQEYGIQGYPTIKVFLPGKPPMDYQGAREAKPIAEFALKQVFFPQVFS